MNSETLRVLFDTSVLVPALVEKHPRHSDAALRLDQVHAGEIKLVISAHTIAELYSTLTALPLSPRISPDEAHRLIVENVLGHAEVVPLDASDYEAVMNQVAEMGLSSGIIYDALHAQAARKTGVARLWTMNERDFYRVWPDHEGIIEGI